MMTWFLTTREKLSIGSDLMLAWWVMTWFPPFAVVSWILLTVAMSLLIEVMTDFIHLYRLYRSGQMQVSI